MRIAIMAGGSGTRFWPLSRRSRPKQYLGILGRLPMMLETWERVRPIADPQGIALVVNGRHRELTERIFEGRDAWILAEPRGRNTAPCMGLACLFFERDDPSSPVAFIPADHAIEDGEAFRGLLLQAERIASSGSIVTLGIVPARPETGYGYIRRGEPVACADGAEAYRVEAFVEKPDRARAEQYVESGLYFWNGGMFIARPDALLSEMEKHLPDLYAGLQSLRGSIGRPDFESSLARAYEAFPSVSIDYGIMEKTTRPLVVLPARFGWTDVGSWQALYEHRAGEQDGQGNVVDGKGVLLDTSGSLVVSRSWRLVACLGLRDCLVVDTGDAVLVADLRSSQSVRDLLAAIEARGLDDLL